MGTQPVGEVDQLAYRYGVLVTASGRNLTTYLWDGKQWQMRHRPAPLSSTAGTSVRSLILDDGFAFVLATEGWYVIALDNVQIRHQRPEPCSFQAKRGTWWVRIKKGDSPEQSILVIMNCATWTEIPVVLPVPLADVTDMVMGDVIYVASSNGDIFVVDPATGQCDTKELFVPWRRLALQDRRVIMLGSNQNGQTVLGALAENGQMEGPFHHSERLLTDMAVVNDEVYIGGENQIAQYRASILSQKPSVNTLPQNEQTQKDFIALRDQTGSVRLVLYRKDEQKGHLYLYDPIHGSTTPIGSLLQKPPQFCMADKHLVVALREASTKLNTYVLGEEAK